MAVITELERKLAELRCRELEDEGGDLRTSTMTHVVWAPPRWLPKARAVFAGLVESHPARTIFLIPQPGAQNRISGRASLKQTPVIGLSREVFSEVIELRVGGKPKQHPASLVLPLLISDLPAFCRWRGEPPWGATQLDELVGVCDRLVVDSGEWPGLPDRYRRLTGLFDRVAVSDLAFARTLPWRIRLAELWPAVRNATRVRVEGPGAEAHLFAGWLRSRLRRQIRLTRRPAQTVQAIWVDGERVEPPPGPEPTPSELLSGELDVLGRDPIYEAAVRAAA
jgi:Glucose-6-phosphate dehydrogenase subunit N-terminal domain/Glucose-6-phosphate dehydrogenase subunit C-terminal domain